MHLYIQQDENSVHSASPSYLVRCFGHGRDEYTIYMAPESAGGFSWPLLNAPLCHTTPVLESETDDYTSHEWVDKAPEYWPSGNPAIELLLLLIMLSLSTRSS